MAQPTISERAEELSKEISENEVSAESEDALALTHTLNDLTARVTALQHDLQTSQSAFSELSVRVAKLEKFLGV